MSAAQRKMRENLGFCGIFKTPLAMKRGREWVKKFEWKAIARKHPLYFLYLTLHNCLTFFVSDPHFFSVTNKTRINDSLLEGYYKGNSI